VNTGADTSADTATDAGSDTGVGAGVGGGTTAWAGFGAAGKGSVPGAAAGALRFVMFATLSRLL
jgi:hypothetical protein